MSVCRVKASSGALYVLNRGGTVEFQLHPQCESVVDGAFLMQNAECRIAGRHCRGGAHSPAKED